MKLDERGFPKKPMKPKHWVAWTRANLSPEDWADFYGSQSRLWRRRSDQWLRASLGFALIGAGSGLLLVVDLLLGLS